MIRFLLVFVLLLIIGLPTFSQDDYFMTPQNKAYIYHTVRKSPILENNIGRYIVYDGEEIRFSNGEINYDSTETIIINNPEKLKIYTDEIRRSPKGLLAELANKMAIWELNTALQSHRSNRLEKDGKLTDYQRFEQLLIELLPPVALKTKKGEVEIHPKVLQLSNPTLTFKDKVAMLDGFASWSEEEKMQVIVAYNQAIITWVSDRSREIFEFLGGESDVFINILTAAGDGSSTSGLFEEREKDEKGRFNRGLPRAVGLFPYDPYIGINPITKKKKPEVLPSGNTSFGFETAGDGKETNIHLDVWGYNSEKQTTVVIQKGNYQYPLFGAENTRFLSPDSLYSGGMTYYTLIHRLEKDIEDMEERISGKKGIDYWIQYYEDLKDVKQLSMDKTEKELSEMRQTTITTTTTKKKVKTTSAQKKQRKKKQEKVVYLFGEIQGIKATIEDLKREKEHLIELKQELEAKLANMYNLIGRNWVPFKEKDGLYVFADSTRFDLLTQEFTFPATDKPEPCEIRLIAMPLSHKSSQYDEVMLHINITDAFPEYTSQIQLEVKDLFDVDQYELLQTPLFSLKDSIGIMEFFEALLDKKKDFKIIARGGGVGKWSYNRVVIDYDAKELSQYPGNTPEERQISKQDSIFKRLRSTEVIINIDREITMQVNSFTDPVRSNFTPESKKMQTFMQQNRLTGNQMLSAYRTNATLTVLQDELIVLASEYLSREDSAKVIDRLNKAFIKVKITVGKTSVKIKE